MRVRIWNQLTNNPQVGPYFALKQFELDQENLWHDEVEALTRLSRRLQDTHLIRLLFAYEHEDHGFFLIFPLAEGSLADYWRFESSRSRIAKGPGWLLEQCRGIADGLAKIHRAASEPGVTSLGRHGDIKPGNILWFKRSPRDCGRLVLADFTSARFHSPETAEMSSTGTAGITRTYCPPEVDLNQHQSQAYDVWSLGCVYLEFVTWYLLGDAAIRRESFIDSSGQPCLSFSTLRRKDDKYYSHQPEDKFFNIIKRHKSDDAAMVKGSVKQVR